jgi:hypothetical protein
MHEIEHLRSIMLRYIFYLSVLSLRKTSERFLSCLIKRNHVSSLVETRGQHQFNFNRCSTWYPQACRFLRLLNHHHIHSSYEKWVEEQYSISKIVEMICFDDHYFPCKKKNCKLLLHVHNWLNLSIFIMTSNYELLIE